MTLWTGVVAAWMSGSSLLTPPIVGEVCDAETDLSATWAHEGVAEALGPVASDGSVELLSRTPEWGPFRAAMLAGDLIALDGAEVVIGSAGFEEARQMAGVSMSREIAFVWASPLADAIGRPNEAHIAIELDAQAQAIAAELAPMGGGPIMIIRDDRYVPRTLGDRLELALAGYGRAVENAPSAEPGEPDNAFWNLEHTDARTIVVTGSAGSVAGVAKFLATSEYAPQGCVIVSMLAEPQAVIAGIGELDVEILFATREPVDEDDSPVRTFLSHLGPADATVGASEVAFAGYLAGAAVSDVLATLAEQGEGGVPTQQQLNEAYATLRSKATFGEWSLKSAHDLRADPAPATGMDTGGL